MFYLYSVKLPPTHTGYSRTPTNKTIQTHTKILDERILLKEKDKCHFPEY